MLLEFVFGALAMFLVIFGAAAVGAYRQRRRHVAAIEAAKARAIASS